MKTHLQCGYEDMCVRKDCIECPRKETMTLTLTQAEKTMIEDIGTCDIKSMFDTHEDEMRLNQDIARQLMFKIFAEEEEDDE